MGVDIALFGAGFLYDSEDAELRAIQANQYWATTLDMQKICLGTPGVAAFAIGSVSELHARLIAVTTKISRLRLIGHSDGTSMGFAGILSDPVFGVTWRPAAGIDPDILLLSRKFLQESVKGKLEQDAEVIVYGCHSANNPIGGGSLLQAVANTFQLPTRGFLRGIDLCIDVTRVTAADKEAAAKAGNKDMKSTFGRILSRGWFREATGKRVDPHKSCSKQGFVQSLDKLSPSPAVRPQPKPAVGSH